MVIAQLERVTRFEASGEMKCSLPPGTYTFSWRIFLLRPSGWGSDPVLFTLSKNNEPVDERKCFMTLEDSANQDVEHFKLPTIRIGETGWREFDVGEFVVESEEKITHLNFAMSSAEGDCKTGLFMDGVVLQQQCPSGCSSKVVSALDPSPNSGSESGVMRWIFAARSMNISAGEDDPDDSWNWISDHTSL